MHAIFQHQRCPPSYFSMSSTYIDVAYIILSIFQCFPCSMKAIFQVAPHNILNSFHVTATFFKYSIKLVFQGTSTCHQRSILSVLHVTSTSSLYSIKTVLQVTSAPFWSPVSSKSPAPRANFQVPKKKRKWLFMCVIKPIPGSLSPKSLLNRIPLHVPYKNKTEWLFLCLKRPGPCLLVPKSVLTPGLPHAP